MSQVRDQVDPRTSTGARTATARAGRRARAMASDAPADAAFRRARAALDAFASRPDAASFAFARDAVDSYRRLVSGLAEELGDTGAGPRRGHDTTDVAVAEFLRASDAFSRATPGRAHGTRTRFVRRSLVVVHRRHTARPR